MLGELYQTSGATPELFHKFIMNSSSEMSKASRRKQSKPNRLLANEEGGHQLPPPDQASMTNQNSPSQKDNQVQSPPTATIADQPVHDTEDKDPMDLSTKGTSPIATPAGSTREARSPSPSNAEPNAASPSEMQMIGFPCHTCGEVFASRALQEQHVSERHGSDSGLNKVSPSGPIFPTAYHKLATELGLNPIGSGLMPPLSVSKASYDSSKVLSAVSNGPGGIPKPGTPGVGGKGTAGTVFQREAYCEICQREFCNKYFLKTHKANIHGIIDPNDPKSAAVAAKLNQVPKATHQPSSASSTPAESVMAPKATGSVAKITSSDNMDDFCEICQKHFCNKYYLKKHKVDVHNIRPDGSKPPISAASVAAAAAAAAVAESHNDMRQLGPGVPVSSGLQLPMMVPPLNSLNPSSMSNMLFVNPFVPSMAAMSMVPPMMQHQFFMPGVGGLAAAANPAANISPEAKIEQKSNSGSEKSEVKSQLDKGEAFCNICKKEFCNSYFLQVHKASKHGVFEDPAVLMMMAAEKEKAEREIPSAKASPSPDNVSSNGGSNNTIRPVVLSSDMDRAKTSPAFTLNSGAKMPTSQQMMPSMPFDAMIAAKQADRITCDICNKEVCNKYFLKAHKLKMHGISSPSDETTNNSSKDMTDIKRVPSRSPLEQTSPDATPENLAKLGIDPEAYCFLCKKEFCSKYFLRTHKLNIHGIRTEESLQKPVKDEPTPPSSTSPISLQPFQTGYPAAEMYQWRLKNQMQMKGIPSKIIDKKGSSANEKFTWRWKETANSTRVFCDICNKELCNKYFLRTHKLNIHGISDTASPSKSSRVLTASNMMADLARASQAGMQKTALSPSNQTASHPTSGVGRSQSPLPDSQSSSPLALAKAESMSEDFCQVCGMVFPDVDAVNDHMKSEHSDENIEALFANSEHEDDGKKIYSCTQCNYKTSILSNVYSHEARKHNPEMNTCKTCHVSFSHINMLVKHMRQVHKKFISLAMLKRMTRDIPEGTTRRKIQCNFCHEKFISKQLCQSHIRNSHGVRVQNSRQYSQSQERVFACDRCKYTCQSIRNLRRHQAMKHRQMKRNQTIGNNKSAESLELHSNLITMQEFAITKSEGIGSLATKTISLPVYNEVTEKMHITLVLTPSTKSSQQKEFQEDSLMDTTTS